MTGDELDLDARAELRSLPKDLAIRVARHLVMAGRLAEEEPETAYAHAKAARRLASRVGLVREAAGFAAYHAGEWAEALAELRAARRLSSADDSYLPIMADCERGLGRPERALDLVKTPEAKKLDQAGHIELRIVESGARRDLGQYEAAVVTLQVPELKDRRLRPWSARLLYAYADALAEAGRGSEAAEWFARASAADRDGETDAAERYAELEGLQILDTEDDTSAEAAETAEPSADVEAEPADVPRPSDSQDEAEDESEEEAEDEEQEAVLIGPDEDVEAGFAESGSSEPRAEAGGARSDVRQAEPSDATTIAFMAAPAAPETAPEAPSGVAEEPAGDESAPEVPEAPAVFLEPQETDEPDEGEPSAD